MSLTDFSRPRILVFAGPNGSGKSTISRGFPICGTYVNADEIKRVSQCTDLEAAQEAELIRNMLLEGRKDFTFETVLSTDRNLKLLRQAKEQGYEIQVVFVLTSNPCINVSRVRARVKAGGHDVPEEKIISRYERSLRNLAKIVRIADHTRVIDNSENEPHLICEVLNQLVTIWETAHWNKKEIVTCSHRLCLRIEAGASRSSAPASTVSTGYPRVSHGSFLLFCWLCNHGQSLIPYVDCRVDIAVMMLAAARTCPIAN